MSEFLLETLPIVGLATLTLPPGLRSFCAIDTFFPEWVASISRRNGLPIAWIRADEDAEWPHSHALLVAYGHISFAHAEESWLALCGTDRKDLALVESYSGESEGARYVLKSLESDKERIRLSDNIAQFSIDRDPAAGNARERRDYRRIRSQMETEFLSPLRQGVAHR